MSSGPPPIGGGLADFTSVLGVDGDVIYSHLPRAPHGRATSNRHATSHVCLVSCAEPVLEGHWPAGSRLARVANQSCENSQSAGAVSGDVSGYFRGDGTSTFLRLAQRTLRPLVPLAARTALGRSVLLAGLRSTPWRASETEARALRAGFGDADAYWQMLWCGILTDFPTGLYGAGHAPQSDPPGVILRLIHECTAAATERAAGRAPTLTALRPPA